MNLTQRSTGGSNYGISEYRQMIQVNNTNERPRF